jgi:hypothetical protein
VRERRTEAAVVAGVFTSWTGAVEVDLTDAADVVFRDIPAPSGNRVPFCDPDLHPW